ncbi:MAG: hypothetical protein LBF16_04075 [Pseudomonadales bacterium]|jgi:hypothetical protein|nr:hypothetical protein [Pseudomonadales bacterium]
MPIVSDPASIPVQGNIPRPPHQFDTFDNIIYALRSTWINIKPPQADGSHYGDGYAMHSLLWSRHKGYADGVFLWDEFKPTSDDDWSFKQVVPGPVGLIYAVDSNDNLWWYDHLGRADGSKLWAKRQTVGVGWHILTTNPRPKNMLGIFCDTQNGSQIDRPNSIIYAVSVRDDRTLGLDWYRHDGVRNGAFTWAYTDPKFISGIKLAGQQRIFSGSNGIIYLIGDDGQLRWYKHKGYQDGSSACEGPNVISDVSSDWSHFSNVFSIGRGIIYAITRNGDLWWFKHKGYLNGDRGLESSKAPVGVGWNNVSVVCNSVYLHPNYIN